MVPTRSRKAEPKPRMVPEVKVPIDGEKDATVFWLVKETVMRKRARSQGCSVPLGLGTGSPVNASTSCQDRPYCTEELVVNGKDCALAKWARARAPRASVAGFMRDPFSRCDDGGAGPRRGSRGGRRRVLGFRRRC